MTPRLMAAIEDVINAERDQPSFKSLDELRAAFDEAIKQEENLFESGRMNFTTKTI